MQKVINTKLYFSMKGLLNFINTSKDTKMDIAKIE